jgi:hypothetical protein
VNTGHSRVFEPPEMSIDVVLPVLSLPEADEDGEVEPSTRRTIDTMLFESLRRRGHGACSEWLASHGEALGKRATVDLHQRYLRAYRQGTSAALR